MPRIADVATSAIARELRTRGLALDLGGARVCIRSFRSELAPKLQMVYGEFPFENDPPGFFDVRARVERARSWRGRRRKELSFIVDGELPFDDMPQALDLPMFEWGINWYIAERGNHRLMLHAGVVERDGFALVLPALPGSGKSTLTAALATCGWRLLSDEFGPLDPADGRMIPMLRPVGLKNESIAIIRRFAPHAVLGPEFPGTHKGTVAHLAPDAHSVALRHQPARPIAVLFPKYDRGQAQRVERMPGGRAFIKLAGNSFNYSLLGPVAFASLRRLVEDVACYRIVYSTLEQAVDIAETLHRELLPRSTPPRTSTTSAAAGMLRVSG